MLKHKFIQDLQDIVDELTFKTDNSISFISEKDLEFFFKTFQPENQITFKNGISFLRSRMQNDYDCIGTLVKQRQQGIQEKLHQNESIMKITDALNNVGNMLDQTSVNSFPLSDYRQSLDALIKELEEDYCIAVDEDLTDRFTQAGKDMITFLDALENDSENSSQNEILLPPKEEIAELVKKIFLDYDLATYLIFQARKFERSKN
jgi:hypothetical protein